MNTRRLDKAINAIYKSAPLGELAHGYPWEACTARYVGAALRVLGCAPCAVQRLERWRTHARTDTDITRVLRPSV